jgi:S-adenosylmethionine decarboxylase
MWTAANLVPPASPINGIEWLIDAYGCAPERLRNPQCLRQLFDRLILELDLRPIGETAWHQFPDAGGITGLCLLAESHLACHTFPEFGSLCLNLFCCVPREEWDFETELKRAVCATSVTIRTLVRPYAAGKELAVEAAHATIREDRE